ncbi:hypothetical protein FA13DRAFT_1796446 [Coprinellus micaceus]|uniref:F-box domain-containing protein n=1 Tax=Coprinellus micaceus TaxID=71717 RepID=A0A4Y7SUQ1_COPMI|nr:hypothetical protein FA13DRAFT_1796446 [Coprinellus micaceus]
MKHPPKYSNIPQPETRVSPYIATELVEFVIDTLGELLPTSSAAFQTLLSFALTGRRALPQSQQHLFTVLVFDSVEHKGRRVPAWKHLENMLNLFKRKPHLALHVRRVKISFYRVFSPNALNALAVWGVRGSSERIKHPEVVEETMLPQLLGQLRNIVSFSFNGLGCQLGGYPWYSLTDNLQQSIKVFLSRPKEDGNALEAFNLDNVTQIPPELFKNMPPSLLTLHLATVINFDWPLTSRVEKTKLLHAQQWHFVLTSLDFCSRWQGDFLEMLLAYGSGKHLSQLQSLSYWIESTQSSQTLGRLLSICASTLRSLDVSSYGESRHREFLSFC